MDKLLYVAMTGASQNALAQKAHANNLANISTNGFQRDLEQARSMPVFGDSFPARAFAMTERPATDFSEGPLVETGRDLDVAVTGKGFIAVQAPDGVHLLVDLALAHEHVHRLDAARLQRREAVELEDAAHRVEHLELDEAAKRAASGRAAATVRIARPISSIPPRKDPSCCG